jgi:putative cardiolipin synthase
VKIDLYTNSLGSTDAVYVAANMYLGVPRWLKSGIGLYVHDGQWTGSNEHTPKAVQKAKWGTHAKVQIYQSTHSTEVMVGTYNVDNRSNYYNTEMALFCKGNDEFTQEVRASVKAQMKKAMRVVSKKHAIDRNGVTRNVYGASKKDIFKLKLFTGPSWLINFLL